MGIIVARHYSQLLLLDVETLPVQKLKKKKSDFMRKRAAKESAEVYGKWKKRLSYLTVLFVKIQSIFRRFVGSVERKAAMEGSALAKKVLTPEQKDKQKEDLHDLLASAQKDAEQGDLITAEKEFLAALQVDPKNKAVYKGLATVYLQQGQKKEAKETYQFVLKIDPNDEEIYLKLGLIAEEENKIEEAVEYYQEAVMINPNNPVRFVKLFDLLFGLKEYETALEAIQQALILEGQNPKYLDNFVEVSILLGRKDLAEDGYQQLRMINPENQKLQLFRQRIDELK